VTDAAERLFREHAIAVFRRDQAEITRTQGLLYPECYLAHQLFTFALFAAAMVDHFGDDFDRARLADLMASLRAARPGIAWLRAEALVRICYGESSLYMDVPQSEQFSLMWAVLEQVITYETSDSELEALFEDADEFGRQTVTGVWRAARLFGFSDEDDDPGADLSEPNTVGEEA
jgi:hypothetical protein